MNALLRLKACNKMNPLAPDHGGEPALRARGPG